MKKIKYARFHGNLYSPGVGELGNVLPSQSKSFQDFSMTWEGSELSVKLTNKGEKVSIVIPSANIMLMVEENS